MPDNWATPDFVPTDLAATLRRLADETTGKTWQFNDHDGDYFVASTDPDSSVVSGGTTFRSVPVDAIATPADGEFIAWCRNNAVAVASALERGAAAEAVLVNQRAWDRASTVVIADGANPSLYGDLSAAWARYDALKEASDG